MNDVKNTPPQWKRINHDKAIRREFAFANFHDTMAFVNAVAWIAHQTNHHPDIEMGYNYCHLTFTTHNAGGLTAKDIDSAQKVNALAQ